MLDGNTDRSAYLLAGVSFCFAAWVAVTGCVTGDDEQAETKKIRDDINTALEAIKPSEYPIKEIQSSRFLPKPKLNKRRGKCCIDVAGNLKFLKSD
ncbi:hypothetical protein [Erwinia persicina]|uniref:hypothetical protein n=1 Tax=Erwinia persicina TaxID=55211 RepID=UPI00177EA408|nr:hypothetical protein [Erwinia persicina]MBD8165591.1 hypothetical protein [Erwinia persicina]